MHNNILLIALSPIFFSQENHSLVGISWRDSWQQGLQSKVHHVGITWRGRVSPRGFQSSSKTLGSKKEPPWHDLREDEPCHSVLLWTRNNPTCHRTEAHLPVWGWNQWKKTRQGDAENLAKLRRQKSSWFLKFLGIIFPRGELFEYFVK